MSCIRVRIVVREGSVRHKKSSDGKGDTMCIRFPMKNLFRMDH